MKAKLWLLIPMFVAGALDVAWTLSGQGAAYWENFGVVNELDAPSQILLLAHPALLALGVFAYLALTGVVVLLVPSKIGKVLVLTQTICNAFGVYMWMAKQWPSEIPGTILAMVLAAVVFWSIRKYDQARTTRHPIYGDFPPIHYKKLAGRGR